MNNTELSWLALQRWVHQEPPGRHRTFEIQYGYGICEQPVIVLREWGGDFREVRVGHVASGRDPDTLDDLIDKALQKFEEEVGNA